MFTSLSFSGYFDLLLVLYKFLEPNMLFSLGMDSGIRESNVCDNLIGLINHEHRESGVVLPAGNFLNTLVQILADPLLHLPCLASH